MNLVRDLAIILVSAGVFAIISRALKQPLILGYIVAGFLIGPNFHFFPGISGTETVNQWSDIGIIFLMFGLGLEFSFRKLLKVGSTALVTAGAKFLGCFVLGFVAGNAMGWTMMESVFFGGLLSMSSTMVVIKAYDDMGLKDTPYAGMSFGTLVVQDLIAIVMLVLLSTMAVSHSFSGSEMLFNIAKLVFFLVLWFLVGLYVIPSLLKKARGYLNDEILLIVSIGLCFAMVSIAEAVGFSSALGAFVMGSILAETVESEWIDKLVVPIKNLFGAVFFISVGMMLSPAAVAEHWLPILVITLLVVVSTVFVSLGVLLTGGGLRNSIYTGLSLAQLGEFGFIIVGVGVSLGVMRGFIYPVIIAVSVITTFLTPYFIKAAEPLYLWLKGKLPEDLLSRIDEPAAGNSVAAEKSEWKQLITSYSIRIVLYGVLILAVMIAGRTWLAPALEWLFPGWNAVLIKILALAITLAVMAPFLAGMNSNPSSITDPMVKLSKEKASNRWPILGLIILRSFITVAMIVTAISVWFELKVWALALVILAALAIAFSARRGMHRYSRMEEKLLSNLNEKEELSRRRQPVRTSLQEKMAGYDVHLDTFEVSPDSTLVGQRLKEVPIRSETGANIIKLSRGSRSIIIPSGDTMLYPGDRLLAVGTTAQLSRLKSRVEEAQQLSEKSSAPEFGVVAVELGEGSYLSGKTLKNTNMRDYHCMVVSVLRDEELITNPRPDFKFQAGDTVWVAGELSSCEWISG